MIRREEIVEAVVLLMGSEEVSASMRRRVEKLGDDAKKSIEEDGSSYKNDAINR